MIQMILDLNETQRDISDGYACQYKLARWWFAQMHQVVEKVESRAPSDVPVSFLRQEPARNNRGY